MQFIGKNAAQCLHYGGSKCIIHFCACSYSLLQADLADPAIVPSHCRSPSQTEGEPGCAAFGIVIWTVTSAKRTTTAKPYKSCTEAIETLSLIVLVKHPHYSQDANRMRLKG